ncbi:MAG: hypothetical protein R2710_27905 [Acidimicrobiales bacterium]
MRPAAVLALAVRCVALARRISQSVEVGDGDHGVARSVEHAHGLGQPRPVGDLPLNVVDEVSVDSPLASMTGCVSATNMASAEVLTMLDPVVGGDGTSIAHHERGSVSGSSRRTSSNRLARWKRPFTVGETGRPPVQRRGDLADTMSAPQVGNHAASSANIAPPTLSETMRSALLVTDPLLANGSRPAPTASSSSLPFARHPPVSQPSPRTTPPEVAGRPPRRPAPGTSAPKTAPTTNPDQPPARATSPVPPCRKRHPPDAAAMTRAHPSRQTHDRPHRRHLSAKDGTLPPPIPDQLPTRTHLRHLNTANGTLRSQQR